MLTLHCRGRQRGWWWRVRLSHLPNGSLIEAMVFCTLQEQLDPDAEGKAEIRAAPR